jgi:hypothetical protein
MTRVEVCNDAMTRVESHYCAMTRVNNAAPHVKLLQENMFKID